MAFSIKFIGISNLMVGLVIVAISIPLIYDKVPMNSLYGIRFKQSFDESVKSFSRPYMAKYPKGTLLRCQYLLFHHPDAFANDAVRTLVPE